MIAGDPYADLTDIYAFVSPDRPDFVTLIMNAIPYEDPMGGPNYYAFDQWHGYQQHREWRERWSRSHRDDEWRRLVLCGPARSME